MSVVSDAVARQRIAELERALAVSERCLISLTKALEKEGYEHSAGAAPPAAFYCYSPDRKGEHAEALLGQCRGFLHADGYGRFQSLYMPDPKRTSAPDRSWMLVSCAP